MIKNDKHHFQQSDPSSSELPIGTLKENVATDMKNLKLRKTDAMTRSYRSVAYIQTIKDEKITLCGYTAQSFMFYTFVRYTFDLKNKGKTVIEYKILKYRKLKMI